MDREGVDGSKRWEQEKRREGKLWSEYKINEKVLTKYNKIKRKKKNSNEWHYLLNTVQREIALVEHKVLSD